MTENFGFTENGDKVVRITIEDEQNNKVCILNYGATVQSLVIDGTDVVLGYDNVAGYEKNDGCLGATIGRCANRISNSCFILDGKEIHVSENKPNHVHIHGGFRGFDRKIWDYEEIPHGVVMTLFSPDGEEGYPGNVTTKVTFTFEKRILSIVYDAVSDKKTVINLTNHSYFNLDGEGEIENHTLQMNCSKIAAIDELGLVCGGTVDVKGTAFDFTDPKLISWGLHDQNPILVQLLGYDHNFIVDGNPHEFKHVATLHAGKKNIEMNIFSDMDDAVVYSGNHLQGQKGKAGRSYLPHSGICFECQYMTNAVNVEGFEKPIFDAGEHFSQRTEFRF